MKEEALKRMAVLTICSKNKLTEINVGKTNNVIPLVIIPSEASTRENCLYRLCQITRLALLDCDV
jgi:hypothetical protein